MVYFEKALELDPQQHMVLAEIGWIYSQQQLYDKAIDYVSQAIEATSDGSIADYYYKLGRIYWMMEGTK